MGYYNKALTNEPEITKHIKAVAENTKLDIQGLENRIKTKDSYLRKIRSNYEQGKTEYEIKDIIRYTYTSKPEDIVGKTQKAIDIGSKQGYNTIEVKNYWLDKNNPYNGINTTVQASNGQKFELQYHTEESFEIKNGKMHELYEEQRLISNEESKQYSVLRDKMFELSDNMQVPKNIEVIKNV